MCSPAHWGAWPVTAAGPPFRPVPIYTIPSLPGPTSFPERQSLWGINLGETLKTKESDFPHFQMGKLRLIHPFILSPNSLLKAYYVPGSVLGVGDPASVPGGEMDNATW